MSLPLGACPRSGWSTMPAHPVRNHQRVPDLRTSPGCYRAVSRRPTAGRNQGIPTPAGVIESFPIVFSAPSFLARAAASHMSRTASGPPTAAAANKASASSPMYVRLTIGIQHAVPSHVPSACKVPQCHRRSTWTAELRSNHSIRPQPVHTHCSWFCMGGPGSGLMCLYLPWRLVTDDHSCRRTRTSPSSAKATRSQAGWRSGIRGQGPCSRFDR